MEFSLGRNSEFDILAASAVKQDQSKYGNHNSSLNPILPYPVSNMEYYENYYDSIIIPDEIGISHPEGAITKRNKWLAKNSDMLIAYVHPDKGGAAACLREAEKLKPKIIRI